MNNPWSGNLDRYLFYNCPECDEKSIGKASFIKHALNFHASAKEVFSEVETRVEDIEIKCVPLNEHKSEFDTNDPDYDPEFEENQPPSKKRKRIKRPAKVKEVIDQKNLPSKLDDVNELQCSICDKYFSSKQQLEIHDQENHPAIHDEVFNCTQCNFKAKSEKQLSSHEKSEHKPNYKCDQCDYIPPLWKPLGPLFYLNTHKLRKHGEHNLDGTKCFECGIEFATNTSMLRHLRKKHGVQVTDESPCEICGKSMSKLNLKTHLRYYHGVANSGFFMCLICDILFKTKELETDHAEQVHKNDLCCRKCKVIFDNFRTFNDHLKNTSCTEENPKSFTCSQCNDEYVWFSTKTLERHWVEVHKLHKDVCEICGSQEKNKQVLKLHMKKHNNTFKQKQCHKCGKSFYNTTEMNIHLRSAHNENTFIYKCKYCQKEFCKMDSLKGHINAIHEQSMRYKCDYCEFSSWYPKSVTSHVNAKHKNYKTVPCDFCEEKFVSRRDRDKHIANKHTVVKAME